VNLAAGGSGYTVLTIKAGEGAPPRDGYVAPQWVPWAGLASCAAFLLADLAMLALARA